MRRAVEGKPNPHLTPNPGKSPAEIVELQASGALEGDVTLDDFRHALQRTQPSTNASEQTGYERWNDEYGCK